MFIVDISTLGHVHRIYNIDNCNVYICVETNLSLQICLTLKKKLNEKKYYRNITTSSFIDSTFRKQTNYTHAQ